MWAKDEELWLVLFVLTLYHVFSCGVFLHSSSSVESAWHLLPYSYLTLLLFAMKRSDTECTDGLEEAEAEEALIQMTRDSCAK